MRRTTSHNPFPQPHRKGTRWLSYVVVVALGVAALSFWPAQSSSIRATTVSSEGGSEDGRSRSFHRFGEVTVTGAFRVDGAGRNVDTIAFWKAPKASKSLMFVSSKDRSLVEVWRYPFSSPSNERAPLRHRCLRATADSATNGVAVDQRSNLLYVSSNYSPNVCVFSLPDLRHRRTLTSGTTHGLEPNVALLRLRGGAKRLYVSDDSVVHIHNAATGRKLSQFRPPWQLETMWTDPARQLLYVPDEGGRSGVYAYRPDGTAYRWNGRHKFGGRAIFDGDTEGILGYRCRAERTGSPAEGLIVVSDQIDNPSSGNDYEVFDRNTWEHLGKIKLRLPDGSGYVHNTDGIGSVRQQFPRYPGGLFTAVDDDGAVVGVDWSTILRAISKTTGRAVGCGR